MVLLLQGIAVLVAVSVTLFFLAWVRRIEIYHREPWNYVLLAFGYGAIITVIGGASLSSLLLIPLQGFGDCLPFHITATGILSALVIAPVSEELMKALGILAMRPRLLEVEDGIVYGAAVGLGFAATENILYFSAAITAAGAIGLLGTAIVRSLTSTLLHLGATGLTGYGFGRYYAPRKEKTRIRWFGYLLAAILFHAAFNLFASLQLFTSTFPGQIALGVMGLFLGVVLVWSLFGWLRRRISDLDQSSAPCSIKGT